MNGNSLLQIFMILNSQSPNNYLVGGCVRDQLLRLPVKDYDIVTDIPMEVSAALLEDNGWKVKECGEAFLVLHVSKNGEQYEIANFRKDGVYLDGRRPEKVEIGTIDEDANRRDFTINALYQDPLTGLIADPTGKGMADIGSRTLRFIGRPKDRIQEDYLRVFRFYRFLSCKNLVPDIKSMRACRQYFNEAYEKTTAERVRLELERMV